MKHYSPMITFLINKTSTIWNNMKSKNTVTHHDDPDIQTTDEPSNDIHQIW